MVARLHIPNPLHGLAQTAPADTGRWAEITRGLQGYFDEQQEIAATGGIVLLAIAVVVINILIARRMLRALLQDDTKNHGQRRTRTR